MTVAAVRRRDTKVAIVVAGWIALGSCAPIALGDGERRVTARELGLEVILPTLDDVVTRAGELAAAIDALVAGPAQPTLAAAQVAWRSAREPWKQTDAFGFGPATDLRLGVAIDQNPIEPTKIDAEIAGTSAIDDALVESFGANAKGFHAIEYLLFRGGDDAAVLAAFTTDANAGRRRALVVAYARNLERKAGDLRTAWAADHAPLLAEPGSGNVTYPTVKASIDALVNESVFLSELIADARIGKPNGTATGGTPQPALEESGPSDNSLADMTSSLHGIRNIYFGTRDGTPGKGIGALVLALSPVINRDVVDALDAALAAVAAIPTPYRTALVDRRPEVVTAHEAVKELKRILATEVVGILGSTLKFNDNDGD